MTAEQIKNMMATLTEWMLLHPASTSMNIRSETIRVPDGFPHVVNEVTGWIDVSIRLHVKPGELKMEVVVDEERGER